MSRDGWVSLMCMLMACDGVGRSVVGERSPAFAFDVCARPEPCEQIVLDPPQAVPEAAAPIDLTQCSQAGPTLCPASVITPEGQCPPPPLGLARTFQGALDLGQLACSAVELVHAAESGEPSSVTIELQAWNQVRVDVSSVAPATIELVGGQIEHVSLVLHGPVALRLQNIPRVQDLRVVADDAAASVELVRAHGAGLVIQASHGLVRLRRSGFEHVNIEAERIDLESSSIVNGRWQAASLNAVDTTLERIAAAAEHSLLSSCDASTLSFAPCRSLTVVGGLLSGVHLAACAEETAIYGTAVVQSQLEGDMILDAASLGGVVFGLGQVGSITMWESQLTNISFCADSQVLTFGAGNSARCVHCNLTDPPALPAACLLAQPEPDVESSYSCPSLFQLPMCGDPKPERMRPPRR